MVAFDGKQIRVLNKQSTITGVVDIVLGFLSSHSFLASCVAIFKMAGFSMNGVGNMLQEPQQLKPSVQPFAGRLGGNQEYILDRDDPDNEKELKKVPDAAPFLSVREALSPHSFLDFSLWRMAMVEGIGEGDIVQPDCGGIF